MYCYFLQSFGTDQLYIESKSRGRLFSRSTSKDPEISRQGSHISHQHSYQNQKSVEGKKEVKLSDAKQQEEWDKDIPEVPLFRVIALNAKEWWLIVLGIVGAALNGSIFPLFAFLFGEILRVFSLPRDEVLSEIGVWAGLFVILGIVSGVGVFLKVRCCTNITPSVNIDVFLSFFPFLLDPLLHHCW